MKVFLLSCLVICITMAKCKEEKYTTKYDGIDLDEILANERLLTGYVKCLLEQGPCTPDGKELKSNLPDAIDNDCAKCTERQKSGADQVMQYIIDHRPDDWKKLENRYQSDGSYKKKYLESLKREDSKLEDSKEKNDDKFNDPAEMNKDNQD